MTSIAKKDALALLKKYEVDDRVMEHLWAVHDYAMEIAADVECDRNLVEVGSLLHDIGRSRSHAIDHAIIGAEILRKEGVSEDVVHIVERHVGAGLTSEEAVTLGLPPGDYIPKTIEEKIVCHADNLIGSTERVSIQDTIKMARQKWFDSAVDRLIQMHFEVFKPEKVEIPDDSLIILDKALEKYDLLYKTRRHGLNIIVSLYGRDAMKAKKQLAKQIHKSGNERR
ncbi:MAG TPA: HD domain-containing protein [Methanocellaceae archaeon]|jgi:uncharacterized protein (TIGR00295 family)